MTLYLGENLISGVATPIEGARNIGQIITSTIPLSDAGLHLLDGALIQGSGSYADFVTYIAGLVSDYPDLFETEANWQTSVANFGSCEKFVYDSVNNTVRLPKHTTEHGYLVKSYSSGADWYRIYSDGWCEQGSYSSTSAAGTKQINLLVSYKDTDYMIYITSAANNSASGHTFHAIANTQNKTVSSFYTSENEYYGISTVIGYWKTCGYIDITNYKGVTYEYIVIATSTKTDIQVDIDEIATDLNGKADIDLSNINPTQTVKNTIVGWGMPDYNSAVEITATVAGYFVWSEAPCDGFVYTNYTGAYFYINDTPTNTGYVTVASNGAFVSKGKYVCPIVASGYRGYFAPLKGVS